MSVTYSSTPWGKFSTVQYWADLPTASEWIGRVVLVLNSSSIWPINYHEKGWYYSDGATGDVNLGTHDIYSRNILGLNKTFTYNIDGTLASATGTMGKTVVDIDKKTGLIPALL